ncbi:MAG: N-formylglutamate amidohydrolase [Candidatus Thiodiazotropha sp.]
MKLPILISLPHAGLSVPESFRSNCLLSRQQIIEDGDEFALQIYTPLQDKVAAFVTTNIARAVLDMNRQEDDLRKDGVIKTHTCWDIPIWRSPLDEKMRRQLLEQYHRPYHRQLTELSKRSNLILAVDCHTMNAHGPPVGPDPGVERPQVCLGNADGQSCSFEWMEILKSTFQVGFPGEVSINQPFSGGYITRYHGDEMPWVQLELSRGDFATPAEKYSMVYTALKEAIDKISNR